MARFLTGYYRIPPNDAEPLLHPAHVEVSATPTLTFDDAIPDLTGAPLRRLLPLLAQSGIRVVLHGSGYVARQDPAPGSPVTPGEPIRLWLR